jgi:hypothetical protein
MRDSGSEIACRGRAIKPNDACIMQLLTIITESLLSQSEDLLVEKEDIQVEKEGVTEEDKHHCHH